VNQKAQFVKTLEGLAMEDVGIFSGQLVNFLAIWHILYPFGQSSGHWHILWPFGILYPVLVCCIK
jgi:hypothetical protein